MTSLKEILKSVEFVVDANGKKKAAQLSISAWEALLEWLETLEDLQIGKQALKELKAAGGNRERAGWLKWDDVESELE
jgi:hypothetical protein